MSFKITIIIVTICTILLIIASHAIRIFRPPAEITIHQINSLATNQLVTASKGNSPVVVSNLPKMSFVPLSSDRPVSVYQRDPTVYSPEDTIPFGKFWRTHRNKGGVVYQHPYKPGSNVNTHPLYQVNSPLTIHRQHFLSIVPQNFHRRVGRSINEYNIYSLYSGKCRFQLYHPKYQQYLPAIRSKFSNYQYTEILNHRIESDNHKTKHAKFVEIILQPGQALIIPSIYSYGYEASEPSVVLNTVTNCPFTYLFQAGYHLSSLFLTRTT